MVEESCDEIMVHRAGNIVARSAHQKGARMSALRSIVAATDLSAPARHAADRAARLAQGAGASLTLVHAASGSALDQLRRFVSSAEEVSRALLEDSRSRLHALGVDLAARYGVSIDEQLAVGAAVEEIVRAAEARDADLIVTGTRGSTFVRTHVVGSTAERIVRRSQRPVLMVRQTAHEPYRRVLVPIDFSDWSAHSVRAARLVAPDAMLVLMHAVEVPFEGHMRYAGVREELIVEYRGKARMEARERLEALAAELRLSHSEWIGVTVDAGDAWMQILQQEQEQDCDLIVIGKHGRNAVEELILGSTTHMVIAESAGDVLVSTGRAQ